MSEKTKIIVSTIGIVAMFFCLAIVGERLMKKTEVLECEEWIHEAKIYEGKGYYFLPWQIKQCLARGKPLPTSIPVIW